ncbi:MAG: glutathione S-transferase family protein [Pseudomonadota bacterium]
MKNTLVIGSKNYSSWSLRAWLVARKAGLEFDELKLDLDTPEFDARIGNLSPSRTVPALHLGDEVIWDSLAIADVIADRMPHAGLWPDDGTRRAFARCISAEMHSGFPALRSEMPMNCRARGRLLAPSERAVGDVARVLAIWDECAERFGHLDGGLVGGFTIADAMYAPVASRFLTYGVELTPAAQRFVDFIHADPDMQQWQAAAEAETQVLPHEEKGG